MQRQQQKQSHFSGTFAEGTSLALGENGNAIIEVGSDGSTGYFIDYVQCTTADCSTYSDRQVPGTWTNLGLLSLNLGPDGLGRMIAQTDSGTVGHIRPKVPTSLQVLSSPVIPLVSVPGCLPTDYGIAIGTTYQVQDQDGNALKSGSMEPQEKLLNLVLNGSEPINPIPNWWIYGTRLGLEVQSSRMPTGNSWMPHSRSVQVTLLGKL